MRWARVPIRYQKITESGGLWFPGLFATVITEGIVLRFEGLQPLKQSKGRTGCRIPSPWNLLSVKKCGYLRGS
jgi:hypothetical protein